MKDPSLIPVKYRTRELATFQDRAKPFPWYQLTNYQTVEEDRNFSCPIYKICLARAARERWQGFTCRFCDNFTVGREET